MYYRLIRKQEIKVPSSLNSAMSSCFPPPPPLTSGNRYALQTVSQLKRTENDCCTPCLFLPPHILVSYVHQLQKVSVHEVNDDSRKIHLPCGMLHSHILVPIAVILKIFRQYSALIFLELLFMLDETVLWIFHSISQACNVVVCTLDHFTPPSSSSPYAS